MGNNVLIQDVFRENIIPKIQNYLIEIREDVNTPLESKAHILPELLFYHSSVIEFVNIVKTCLNNEKSYYPFIYINSQGVEYGDIDTDGNILVTIKSIVIGTSTLQEFKSEDRDLITIKPILLKIEKKLREVMQLSFRLIYDGQANRKIWYCYGKESIYGVESTFGDVIDAIELKNIKLKIKKNCNE
jgi:hypothetical protein